MELFDVESLARFLKLTPLAVRGLIQRGEIPYFRLGRRRIRFDRDEIEQWIKLRIQQERDADADADVG